MTCDLSAVLAAWPGPTFKATLKGSIEALSADCLPLQAGLQFTSVVCEAPLTAIVLATSATEAALHARVGLLYEGLVPGCSCADDPTPMEAQNEYCEVHVEIDRNSGAARIALFEDEAEEGGI